MTTALVGTKLPEFTLPCTLLNSITLPDDILNSWTLIYFYPKDDTPGCTKQACSYRDNLQYFDEYGIKLLGVSVDGMDSHDEFSGKFNLNFPLIADTDHKLSEALGVYGDQEWQGKTFKGLSRDTFLINPEGVIAQIWRNVSPESTMQETFEAAKLAIES